MTNVGKWDTHYRGMKEPHAYGSLATYAAAAEWVKGCNPIEDWGCGPGWLKTVLVDPSAYVGVDGSASPFADRIVDLTTYRSVCEGLILRHVLEHNYDWASILDNALASFTRRLCIILFTPLSDATYTLKTEPDYEGAPVISFRLEDILERISCDVEQETVAGSAYGVETILRCARDHDSIA